MLRSDCMANPMLWYLMGATEGCRETLVKLDEIKEIFIKWQPRIAQTGTFIMPYAEDADYIGSSAYFYVKQFNQARFFEPEPESVRRFKELLDMAKEIGYELTTPGEVIGNAGELIKNDLIDRIENGAAWHGGTCKAWGNTSYSLIFDPVCRMVYDGIVAIRKCTGDIPELEKALKAVTSAYISDSRWPPLPTTPGRFNVRESLDDLFAANRFLNEAMEKGGIAEKRAIYSAPLMETQIKLIEKTLMEQKYFGE